ncbi:hypothetical protein BC826DRAFT_1023886 [Russula brevipes]|nr:hypothetical protein BC826DRAFT_1023886 [Russula brevipes]
MRTSVTQSLAANRLGRVVLWLVNPACTCYVCNCDCTCTGPCYYATLGYLHAQFLKAYYFSETYHGSDRDIIFVRPIAQRRDLRLGLVAPMVTLGESIMFFLLIFPCGVPIGDCPIDFPENQLTSSLMARSSLWSW